MTNQAILLIFTICATVHLMAALVLAVYARHKVEYLGLTWIMALFSAALWIVVPFSSNINGDPGILHPLMLVTLTIVSYLQSIYPLSIPMPAYLQWGRMWHYALPNIILYVTYAVALLFGWHPLHISGLNDIAEHWYNLDLWWRIAALCISLYYVINVLRLPHKLAHLTELPAYLKGFCTVLGLSVLFYTVVAVYYQPVGVTIYVIIFTLLNTYHCFRTFDTMAMTLPKPAIEKVEEEPTQELIEKADKEDFNEANLQRFHRVEYWMQNHREEWTQSTFNRDQLCEQVGINRHLLLQCVRSQGYNSTHEYLNTYRFIELKRLIQQGKIHSANETIDAGFGTAKTARSVFLQMSGQKLDDFIANQKSERISGLSKEVE